MNLTKVTSGSIVGVTAFEEYSWRNWGANCFRDGKTQNSFSKRQYLALLWSSGSTLDMFHVPIRIVPARPSEARRGLFKIEKLCVESAPSQCCNSRLVDSRFKWRFLDWVLSARESEITILSITEILDRLATKLMASLLALISTFQNFEK